MNLQSLCVYCGSSPGARPAYVEAARTFGQQIAATGIRLVYGGGNVGIMGAIADSVMAAGGEVIGVIPEYLATKELAHAGLTELHRVNSMHERKLKMAELSDAFVALPGGVGTIEEIFEVFTWTQLGLHAKPCAFLNVEGYYDNLSNFLEHMTAEQFIKKNHLTALLFSDNATDLLQQLRDYQPSLVDKWMGRNSNDSLK